MISSVNATYTLRLDNMKCKKPSQIVSCHAHLASQLVFSLFASSAPLVCLRAPCQSILLNLTSLCSKNVALAYKGDNPYGHPWQISSLQLICGANGTGQRRRESSVLFLWQLADDEKVPWSVACLPFGDFVSHAWSSPVRQLPCHSYGSS